MEDVIQAPMSLIYENSKRVVGDSLGAGSTVKSVLIGEVPDRGGRAGDIKSKSYARGGHDNFSRYRLYFGLVSYKFYIYFIGF